MTDRERLSSASRDADIIFDAVGGALADAILAAIRPEARFISYGLLSSTPIMRSHPAGTIQQFHLRAHLHGFIEVGWREGFAGIWQRLRQTTMPETSEFPLARWREALSAFERPGRLTKPLLQMCPGA